MKIFKLNELCNLGREHYIEHLFNILDSDKWFRRWCLTLCILMDSPILFDTVNLGMVHCIYLGVLGFIFIFL